VKAPLKIGTAQGNPGELSYGTFEAVPLPTGSSDHFPIIIAQGKRHGAVLWITASIHGNEYTGIVAIHRLLSALSLETLRGAVVCIPTLNPSGLRVGERRPYYLKYQDPNRLFPTPVKKPTTPAAAAANQFPADPEPLSALEQAYQRLFEVIMETGDYLIDLHNYSINSLPFAFRDPIGYTDEHDKAAARQLQLILDGMLQAFGHTIINEFATADYLKRNLHRSVSGAVLNAARIPAFTVELGGYLTVDPAIVDACNAGIRNVMRWANMLDGAMEAITGVPILKPDYPIRRTPHPFAPHSGIVDFFVKSGDPVTKGMPIARITDIFGRVIGADAGLIRSDHDGFVLGISQGAAFYQNETITSLAIRDDSELLVPFLT
jgi:hypothetical protein